MAKVPQDLSNINSLVEIVAQMRGPQGCPWIKEQTHQSLVRYAIEEVCEFAEALEAGLPPEKVSSELGDVLLQVVLHSEIAKESGTFTLADVVRQISEKMLRRHPHVFEDTKVSGVHEVLKNWELIKKQESDPSKQVTAESNLSQKTLLDVPITLPSLQRAHKIGERTERIKFDWDNPQQVWEKVQEEVQELQEVLNSQFSFSSSSSAPSSLTPAPREELIHELGDILFSLAQLARHLHLDPEQCLRSANLRFEKRFEKMVELSGSTLEGFSKLTLTEKESLWSRAKRALK